MPKETAPEQADLQRLLALNRGHWSIEKSCHHIIDRNYHEDRSRIRTDYGLEHLRYLVSIDGQVVACLSWASAAWKVKARDAFIGWDEEGKRRKLHFIANNTRFLIPEWVKVKHLASRVLALNLKRLSADGLAPLPGRSERP